MFILDLNNSLDIRKFESSGMLHALTALYNTKNKNGKPIIEDSNCDEFKQIFESDDKILKVKVEVNGVELDFEELVDCYQNDFIASKAMEILDRELWTKIEEPINSIREYLDQIKKESRSILANKLGVEIYD